MAGLVDPTKIGAEVHWTEGGLAVMLPFKSDAEELDLHILEVACLRDQGVFLDEEAHSKLKQVVELSSSLPMAVRWLLRSRNGS